MQKSLRTTAQDVNKSAKPVSREFYLEKRVYIGLGLGEDVAKILCCAKLVFMLFTISL